MKRKMVSVVLSASLIFGTVVPLCNYMKAEAADVESDNSVYTVIPEEKKSKSKSAK